MSDSKAQMAARSKAWYEEHKHDPVFVANKKLYNAWYRQVNPDYDHNYYIDHKDDPLYKLQRRVSNARYLLRMHHANAMDAFKLKRRVSNRKYQESCVNYLMKYYKEFS